MYMFGSGVMTITPAGANPTPINIGLLQEGSVDASRTMKELYGQFADPLAVGAGTRKWSGKAKTARFSAQVMNAIYFGGTLAAGQIGTLYENGSVPAVSGPYTITVAQSGTWTTDQGVIYAATGLPFKRVASGPTVGQYSVAAGVYTFAAADTLVPVVIAYNYSISATGSSILVPPTLLGPTLTFAINFTAVDPTNNAVFTGQFFNAVCSKFSFGTKLEDFAMPEFDFQLFANAAGNIGQFNFPDKF